MTATASIICADWSRSIARRSAWYVSANSLVVRPMEGDVTLTGLIHFAHTLPPPVLVGIDAALGVPATVVEEMKTEFRETYPGFSQWVQWLFSNGSPDEPVNNPRDWSPARPFIVVPPGKGSKLAFSEAGIQMHREVEKGLNANSPLIVSGIPGTVGSGSRELWRELALCLQQGSLAFNIWPFDGSLDSLLGQAGDAHPITLAEIYPKACYGIALAEKLPTKLKTISKTKENVRANIMNELLQQLDGQLEINSAERCFASEDDFDAMISVVAMHKLMQFQELFFCEPDTHPVEGGIMGKQGLVLS